MGDIKLTKLNHWVLEGWGFFSRLPRIPSSRKAKRRVFKDGLFVGWSKMWCQCWHKPLRFWVLDGTDFLEHELIDLLSALSPWVTSNMMKQISAILYNSYIFNGLAMCVCVFFWIRNWTWKSLSFTGLPGENDHQTESLCASEIQQTDRCSRQMEPKHDGFGNWLLRSITKSWCFLCPC